MSLSEAFLLDPYRMDVYIANRTDGVVGTGSQNDPYDGSSQAKFDALMSSLPIQVSSISSTGNTATVTAIYHGYSNGDQVLIAGATNSSLYNGGFTVFGVTDKNTFQYTMNGSFTGSAAGTISCRRSQSSGSLVPLGVNPPVAVHLGPGVFQTNGYSDTFGNPWQPRPGMKIVGSGVDVTILQLKPNAADAHYYAIGHPVSPVGLPNLVDYFEISDLTVDCNLAKFSGAATACGAVRVMGNHARVRRLKVVNWGTKSTSNPCFVLSVVTASDTGSVEDCGIEECLAINPASTNVGPVTIFHAGGIESPTPTALAYGIAPFIRNCFVDAGGVSPEVRGLSMAWCKAGIIEGNQAHNLTYGTFQQFTAAQDIVIRNNWFKNVNKGILLGNTGAASLNGSLSSSLGVATVTISSGHNVSIGDSVLLNTSGDYNGLIVSVLNSGFSTTQFKFNTSKTTSDTVISVQRAFGVATATIEGNVVELATATGIIAIHADDSRGTAAPAWDASYPNNYFSKMIIRDNKLRYLDGAMNGGFAGYPIRVNGAIDLLVRNNVAESEPANPLRNYRCLYVAYFNNLTPGGVLVPGWNGDNSTQYEELSTIAEFALVMGLFNRKT